jgi:hypothetical protein
LEDGEHRHAVVGGHGDVELGGVDGVDAHLGAAAQFEFESRLETGFSLDRLLHGLPARSLKHKKQNSADRPNGKKWKRFF